MNVEKESPACERSNGLVAHTISEVMNFTFPVANMILKGASCWLLFSCRSYYCYFMETLASYLNPALYIVVIRIYDEVGYPKL